VSALTEIDHEYHNIRLALQWALEAGEPTLAARIFTSLFSYWDLRGLIREGALWAAQVVPLAVALPQPMRARIYVNAGMLAYRQAQPQQAADLASAALAAAETPEEIASATKIAGLAALELGDGTEAQRYFMNTLALAQEYGLIEHVAVAQLNLGTLSLAQGQLAEAETQFQHSYANYTLLGLQPSIGVALVGLGFTALLQGNQRKASLHLYDALQKLNLVREKTMMLYGLLACCGLARLQHQPLLAATLYGAALRQAERAGVRIGRPLWVLAQEQIDGARRGQRPVLRASLPGGPLARARRGGRARAHTA
jgi:tetratricopeptide (TPR) repeat protein